MMQKRARRGRARTWLVRVAGAAAVAAIAFAGLAWHYTMARPEVHRTQVSLPGYPAGEPPVTVALLADIHVAGPDMPPERLARIVAQVNALEPDLVVIAGDLVSDKDTATRIYPSDEGLAPLAELSAPLGVIAVPGNHDHWRDMGEIRRVLEEDGITVLANRAVQAGPLAVGGLDDDFTNRVDLPATLAAMEGLTGGRVILTHSPDIFPDLPDGPALVLAGHTHCGQIGWPWGGSPETSSTYGQRYACGRVDEDGRTLVTSAGLGTSVLPFRLFTTPDIWLVEVGPE